MRLIQFKVNKHWRFVNLLPILYMARITSFSPKNFLLEKKDLILQQHTVHKILSFILYKRLYCLV